MQQGAGRDGGPHTTVRYRHALVGVVHFQPATHLAQHLGNLAALGLKGVPPEARGQAAMEILQNSPYSNPQILAQIQQAAADGRITDDELDNFAQQTMSVAERVKLVEALATMVPLMRQNCLRK